MGIPFESKKRFRINPIEIAIFAAIALIFVKSGYNLLYAHEISDSASLLALEKETVSPLSDGRSPAAISPANRTFTEVTIGCKNTEDGPTVSAKKIRLMGSLCTQFESPTLAAAIPATEEDSDQNDEAQDSAPSQKVENQTAEAPESPQNVKRINIVNTSARVAATVFPDLTNEKFSTDYISLNDGKNLIHIEFEFKDGRSISRELTITKN